MNVLVLAPHPDDEAIGVGGTIRRHIDRGDHVKVVFLTSGETAPESSGVQRELESRNAMEILGYQELDWWRFPDGDLASREDELRKKISLEFKQGQYEVAYVPHILDNHPDHSFAAKVVQDVLKVNKTVPDKVLQYEVWTPILTYTTYNQVTEQIEDKLAAIRAHKSQNLRNKFDMGAIGLNRYRGVVTGWPQGYVEVFEEVSIG